MHIKLVVNSFPSASETFLFNLVVGLESKGHRISLCAMSESKHWDLYKNRQEEWKGELRIIPFGEKGVIKYLSILKTVLSNLKLFIRCIRENGIKKGILVALKISSLLHGNPDIIHFSYSGIGVNFLDALLYVSKSPVKIMISCRGSAEKVKPIVDAQRGKQLRKLFSYCTRVHCVSQDMLEGLTIFGLERNKAFVNFPAINLNYFNRDKPYDHTDKVTWKIVTTGRLHFQKGYVYCLMALHILKRKGYKFIYTILGEGIEKDMLLYLIHEMDMENEIKLLGKVSSERVKETLIETDIFVLPSLYEGIANAALEAMALQIPLISTKAGGMAEVIKTNENGILVERFDPQAIADALEVLFTSQELRKKISKNSRRIIETKFNINTQIEVFLQEYKRMIHA